METPFYHDDVLNLCLGPTSTTSTAASYLGQSRAHLFGGAMMKKELTLNLSDQVVATLKSRGADSDGLLSSPDLGLLKLASPELERLIIQSNGLVTTTPTSSQFLYPKGPNEEQEFAEGFVKALEDLHKQNQLSGAVCPQELSAVPSVALQVSPPQDAPVYANLNNYSSGVLGGATTVNYSTETVPYPPPPPPAGLGGQPAHRLQALKDEPQIVPEVPSFGESPPLSPIDMDTQERIKAERKRLRNRIAASKCRKRKLERISRLEEKVKSLKSQNTELASTANLLREQVAQLKQKVMSHVNSGCQLLPHQVQAY
ncbi:transcription factor jun-D [Rhinatrema bivittatum]|uniref:transcription factor jun-D n=1 Tax=Rhinatrema bivittatum TaxID=194408 RepID=UPI00112832BD|nr:transcription factor jun-D [Rhinatrema bivittatum]